MVAPMRRPHRYRRPNPDRRRALELLAGSREGCTKAMMRAHGFSIDMLVELVKVGLATTKHERMVAGGRQHRAFKRFQYRVSTLSVARPSSTSIPNLFKRFTLICTK